MSFPRYEKYKDSGVEWLGEVPEGWEVILSRRLYAQKRNPSSPGSEQLAATQRYGVIPQREFMALEGQKVVLALSGTDNFKDVRRDDFVISLRSFQGGIERSRHDGCVSPAYTVLRATKQVNADFITYLFKSDDYIKMLQTVTTGIREGKTITYDQFSSITIPIPPLPEQRTIAAFLDHETGKIDALVAEQEKLIGLLKEKRQAVISHAVTKGLDPNARMKDSGVEWLGEVPEGWEVKRLKSLVAEPLKYGANEAAEIDDPMLPRFVRITDIDDKGGLRDETFKSLPVKIAEPYLLKEGDVLLARSGATVGKSFIYSKHWGTACFAGYLIRARLDCSYCLAQWLYYFCQTNEYWGYIVGSQIQATIQNVSAEKYANIYLPIPSTKEQRTIAAFLDHETGKIDTLIEEAQKAIELMKERRTALISAAVTGKIDVRGYCPAEEEEGA